MDLNPIIEDLRREKEILDRAIASVEELQADGDVPVRKRRGRKSMSPEERREVSERMKKSWATRLASRRPSVGSRSS
jgi:hypothetical protein